MKLNYFRKKIVKGIFSFQEAQLVCFQESPNFLRLQLYNWKKRGEILALKRGGYMFTDYKPSEAEIAKSLYEPCYFSLEYVLSRYGIIPEAVFTYTLVTPKPTRIFNTPLGKFSYHTLKKEAFTGFNPRTLLAEKEKALVDYFYFHSSRLQADDLFWKESRIEAMETGINFKKVFQFAKLFNSKKLFFLLTSFHNYAKSYQTRNAG